MFDNVRKKLKDFKLHDIFKRKADPGVPENLLKDKKLRKAIIKDHRKRVRRRLASIFLACAAVSTAVQYTPNLVSTKFDDYMASKGYGTVQLFNADGSPQAPAGKDTLGSLSQNFSTGEIRVYDRWNPLYPFHLAGREVALQWHEQLKETHAAAIPLAIETPFIYTGGLWKGFTDMLPGNKLDAYSMASNDEVSKRVNFIRPPGEFSLNGFLHDFSGVDGRKIEFKSDRQELRNVLFEFVMLHEARHGDQEKRAFITANESDADLYAFKVMQSRGIDPQLLQEAVTIVAHARAINATLGGDQGHVSTFTLERGRERIFDAYQDAADFERLHDLLEEADHRNDKNFPAAMPAGNRYLYLTLAMQKEGLLDEDPGMKKAAAGFVNALAYFDSASGGHIIDRKLKLDKIDLSYLTQDYKPVPDKLGVRTPPPAPGS